ncbi:MAG: serine hydroxymethyltransferase [Gammaproteobacteria bacterium]|nr:serine hydroxymethyltransferase [Gammaproteobacteria bacterium]
MTGRPPHPGYFDRGLAEIDPEVHAALAAEEARQQDGIELIASENIVSRATLDALGTAMVNKTVEGYPGARYYGGAEHADAVERLAIERARRLFACAYANVQPHSGSQANLAVFLAFVRPGETVLSMDLSSGGHLSHGARANLTGKWFDIVHYGVDAATGLIDMDQVRDLARARRPRLIICGGSAYPRAIDFAAFRRVADEVGAVLLADMAHFAGLVAGGQHPSPVPHAHVSTATTYKNLRGVRGGLILADDESLAKKLDSAVFPGVQGSVILNAVAAKAVCLGEALRPEFEDYARQVLANARALADTLMARGVDVVTGGTDTPLMLVDLRLRDVTGADASAALERAGLTCNKNSVPGDTRPPQITSGLRFGVSAGTTRGLHEAEFHRVGELIADVLDALGPGGAVESRVRDEVRELTRAFPIYGH